MNLTQILIFALAVLGFGSLALLVLIFTQKNNLKSLGTQLDYLSRQISENRDTTTQKVQDIYYRLENKVDSHMHHTSSVLQKSYDSVSSHLEKNASVFGDLKEKMGRIEETGKAIASVGEEVSKLQHLFRSPKFRGHLGEKGLEEILSHLLPSAHFKMQYRFTSGDIVDSVVYLANKKIVPMDAKFPLENFQKMHVEDISEREKEAHLKQFVRDIKSHIDKISQKYIRPDENTLDFALMFLPAEQIYYEAFLKDYTDSSGQTLLNIALQKKVIPVSPNSLYAYLQAILLGLRGLQIEERAQEILSYINKFKLDVDQLEIELEKLGKHLNHAGSAYDKTYKKLKQSQNKIEFMENMPLNSGEKDKPLINS
ncbi:MAG TPA: DNA recombination protein RmuC [Oligoflexia bacterium]|nr:DNA recombination protein RmuC [Oligoflexia bacterium]HMR23783.1 DNA recombination protein RmuC [Oligoflexia bacterium]